MNTPFFQQWQITFRWNYNGNSINQKISQREATRDNLNGAIIRIGRDQRSCNLYLEDSSVSGEHAEIYFNKKQQTFFIKSLQPRNILQVDGQDIVDGKDLPLQENSTIVLGLQQIEVTKIEIYPFTATNCIVNSSPNSNPVNPNSNPVNPNSNPVNPNSNPVNPNSNPVNPNSNPVNPNSNPVNLNSNPVNPNSNPIPINLNLNLSNVDPKPDSNKSKHWWQEPTIQAAIIAALVAILSAGITWYSNEQTRQTEKDRTEKTLEVEKDRTKKTLEVEKEKVQLQTYSTEKLDYIKRLTDHKTKIIEILEKNKDGNDNLIYRRLTLKNDCSQNVKIAASYEAPNGIQQTRGWVNLKGKSPNSKSLPQESPPFYTLKSFIHLYAYYQKSKPKSGPKKRLNADEFITWTKENGFITLMNKDGFTIKDVILPSDFDYIENPLFLNQDENDIIGKAPFYLIKLTVDPSGVKHTTKTFTCEGDSLQLKNE